MSVLGKGAREMNAVHLLSKLRRLPTLSYRLENPDLTDTSKLKINVTWNICFQHIFVAVGEITRCLCSIFVRVPLLWPPYVIGQTIMFSSCGFFFFMVALWNRVDHYIFVVWLLLSSSFIFFLFSSPNLSCRRLDVYHTSTHGVT